MAHYGYNMKWTIDAKERERVSAMFTRVFGSSAVQPSEGWEIYKLEGGCGVGVQYVTTATLSREQAMLAPWLEFAVENVKATETSLREMGGRGRAVRRSRERLFSYARGGPCFA